VRRRGGRQRALGTRAPSFSRTGRTALELDFASDAFSEGRRFPIMAIVNDVTRVPGADRRHLAADLTGSARARRPGCGAWPSALCVPDNGTELTSMPIPLWLQERQVRWHYIAPGKLQQGDSSFRSNSPRSSRFHNASLVASGRS
jgi:putative transposase